MSFIKERLTERSTWYGIICLILNAVMIITPDWIDSIITTILPIVGAALLITPDKLNKKDSWIHNLKFPIDKAKKNKKN